MQVRTSIGRMFRDNNACLYETVVLLGCRSLLQALSPQGCHAGAVCPLLLSQPLVLCRPVSSQELAAHTPQVVQCNEPAREVTLYQNMAGKQLGRTFHFDKVQPLQHCSCDGNACVSTSS